METTNNVSATETNEVIATTMPAVQEIKLPMASIEVKDAVIKSNISQIVDVAVAVSEELANTVFTGESMEETLKLIKKNRAALNKAKEQMEAKRKQLKKDIMIPYNGYESEHKIGINAIDKALSSMDQQIETLDNEIRETRRKEIRKFYDENCEGVGDFKETLYQKLYDAAWEKSSVKAYKEGILSGIKNYTDGMFSLDMMTGDYQDEAIALFKDTLNLSEAMAFLSRKRKEKEELLAEERERIQLEAQQKAQEEIEAANRRAEEEKAAQKREFERQLEREREIARREAEERIAAERVAQSVVTQPINEDTAEKKSETNKIIFPESYVSVGISKDDWPSVKSYFQSMNIDFIVS